MQNQREFQSREYDWIQCFIQEPDKLIFHKSWQEIIKFESNTDILINERESKNTCSSVVTLLDVNENTLLKNMYNM